MLKKLNKKNILLIGVPILLLIIIIIVIIILINKNNIVGINNLDGERFKEEYEKLNNINDNEGNKYVGVNISSKNIIKYSTETEILNIINNNGDVVVYFGYPSCFYCRSSIEVLLDTASKTKLDVIYYIDTEKIELSEELQNILKDSLSEELYSSLVIFITDGEIVSYNKDTLSSHKDPYKKLNDYQKEGLSEIYRYGINDVVDSKKIKNN